MSGLLAALVVLPGCALFLLRDLGLEDTIERGSITGRLVRADDGDAPAAFARVQIAGSSRAVRASSEGAFVLTGLTQGSWPIRIVDDPDGDGWPDRVRFQGVRISVSPHATSPVDAVVGASGDVTATGVALGNVPIEKTGALEGRVTFRGGPLPAGVVAKVIATRDLTIEQPDLGNAETFLLGAEAITHVDAEGDFYFGGLGGGQVRVVALVYKVSGGVVGPLVEVSEVGVASVSARVSNDDSPGEAGVLDVDGDLDQPLNETATVALNLTPVVAGGELAVVLVAPGLELPPCEVPMPTDYTGSRFEGARVLTVPSQQVPNVELPLGAWDLQVCDGERAGVLRGQVAYRFGDEVPLWGPVYLGGGDDSCVSWIPVADSASCQSNDDCAADGDEVRACRATGERDPVLGSAQRACFVELRNDCDGDLLPGLPATDNAATDPTWLACAAACSGLSGEALEAAACVIDGDAQLTFDCNDDGDGQADVDEPACYGLDLGDDLDLDQICSPADIFPLCAANRPEACDATTNNAGQPALRLALDPTFGDEGIANLDNGGGGVALVNTLALADDGRLFVGGGITETAVPGLQPAVWSMAAGATGFEAPTTFNVQDPGTVGFYIDGVIHDLAFVPGAPEPALVMVGELFGDPFANPGGAKSRAAGWEVALLADGRLPELVPLINNSTPALVDYPEGGSTDLNMQASSATGVAVPATTETVVIGFEGSWADGASLGIWNPGVSTLGWASESVRLTDVGGHQMDDLRVSQVLVDGTRVYLAASIANGTPVLGRAHVLAFDLATGAPVGADAAGPGLFRDDTGDGRHSFVQAMTLQRTSLGSSLVVVGSVGDQVGGTSIEDEPLLRQVPAMWRIPLNTDGDLLVDEAVRWAFDDFDLLGGRTLGLLNAVADAGQGRVIVAGGVGTGANDEDRGTVEAAAWVFNLTAATPLNPALAAAPVFAVGPAAGGGPTLGPVFNDLVVTSDDRFVGVGQVMIDNGGVEEDGPAFAMRLELVEIDGEAEDSVGTTDPELPEDPASDEGSGTDFGCGDHTGCALDCDFNHVVGCVVGGDGGVSCQCVGPACDGHLTWLGAVSANEGDLNPMVTCIDGNVSVTGSTVNVATALSEVTAVAGDLTASGNLTSILELPRLQVVGGTVRVVNTSGLTRASFPALTAMKALEVTGNIDLETLEIGGTGPVIVSDAIDIQDNPALCQSDVAALPIPVPRDAFSLNENNNLCCEGNCESLGQTATMTCQVADGGPSLCTQ